MIFEHEKESYKCYLLEIKFNIVLTNIVKTEIKIVFSLNRIRVFGEFTKNVLCG